MGWPFTLEPGAVVRLSRFDHVAPEGSRFTFVSRDRKRVYVLLLLGTEDKNGEHPLDGEQVLNAMGWIKNPEKWESDEDAGGSKQLTAEELLAPLKQAEERYEALAKDVRRWCEGIDPQVAINLDYLAIFAALTTPVPQEARP